MRCLFRSAEIVSRSNLLLLPPSWLIWHCVDLPAEPLLLDEVLSPALLALGLDEVVDTGADLVWKPVDGATTYRISRADADGPFAVISDVVGPSFGDSGLKANTAYRWRVSAVVGGVEGPVSIEAKASTLSTPAPCDSPGTCPVGR